MRGLGDACLLSIGVLHASRREGASTVESQLQLVTGRNCEAFRLRDRQGHLAA